VRAPSIRVRLTLWYSAVLAVVLILYSAGILVVVERMLERQLQRGLRDDMEAAEQMLVRTPAGAIDWREEPADHDHDESAVTGRWVEVRGPDGVLLYARPGPAPQGVPLRRLMRRQTIGDLRVTLTVARWTRAADEELRVLRMVVGFGIPVALSLAALFLLGAGDMLSVFVRGIQPSGPNISTAARLKRIKRSSSSG